MKPHGTTGATVAPAGDFLVLRLVGINERDDPERRHIGPLGAGVRTAHGSGLRTGRLPSLRNREFIHAPAHACRTYSANGHDVIHAAGPVGVLRTRQRPGGTNCAAPIFWRL